MATLNQLGASFAEQAFGSDVDHLLDVHHSSIRAPIQRVAIVAEAFLPKVDGVTKTAYLTLRYLQQTGREVLVIAPDIAPNQIGASRIIPMPSIGMPLVPETRVALPHPAVNRHLREFQPDLIHLFSPAFMSFNAMIAGHRMGIPVIANYQTDVPGYVVEYGFGLLARPAREWLRYVHNRCHLTLAPSQFTARQLRQWGYHRLRLWGRGVDSDRFHPKHRSTAMRERLLNGRDPASLLCIYVGRLAAEKRIDLLLDVARTPGVALTIIGDGARKEHLETLFAGTNTHFTGYLYGDDLAHAFASSDVFLFTGPCETFGQVVQEAMASALPCVVINQGGVPDLVEDGKTGYICPPNPLVFANAVITLRDNPTLRQEMAHNSRCFAEERPWSAIMHQLEGHYREAVRMNTRFLRIARSPRKLMPVSS